MAKIYDKFPALIGKDSDIRSRRYITPARIVWTNREEGAEIEGEDSLLLARAEQISFGDNPCCTLTNKHGQTKASLLVDYGMELHGSVRIMVKQVKSPAKNRANIRIRFGESVMEAMTDLGVKNTTNDHAKRDMFMNIGFFSSQETNESGFRFMRIDLLDDEAVVLIKSVNATFIFRDIEYKGSFDCSDPLLNEIWDMAAYTTHLNMQEYLWDGIKRDRLIWIGDMHTEVMTILAAFGYNDVVPKSLDAAREDAPLSEGKINWMNTMAPYSLWWLLIHYDWYMGTGDFHYLTEQKEYMKKLLSHLITLVDGDGVEQMPLKFLDWPNHTNDEAEHAGMQGLLKMALERGAYMMEVLGETGLSVACADTAERMKRHVPSVGGSKSAGALLALAGLAEAGQINDELIAVNGVHGFSTFLGYYLLKAKAMAGDYLGALAALREYWGGMIKMGATTFWEDFQMEWMENAAPINEIVPEGKVDIHGDRGAHCYTGFRRSLCHGWASGPCPFMTHYILGVHIEAPGCRKICIEPHLGDLDYVKGTYPTPFGIISISHTKVADGAVHTNVSAPKEIEIIVKQDE